MEESDTFEKRKEEKPWIIFMELRQELSAGTGQNGFLEVNSKNSSYRSKSKSIQATLTMTKVIIDAGTACNRKPQDGMVVYLVKYDINQFYQW